MVEENGSLKSLLNKGKPNRPSLQSRLQNGIKIFEQNKKNILKFVIYRKKSTNLFHERKYF